MTLTHLKGVLARLPTHNNRRVGTAGARQRPFRSRKGAALLLPRRFAAIYPEGGADNDDCVGREITAAIVLLVDHNFSTCPEELSHLSTTSRKNFRLVFSLGNYKRHG